jgi:hypothetical protein
MTAPYPPPSWCTALPWSSPGSSWTPPSRQPPTSWNTCSQARFLSLPDPFASQRADPAGKMGVHQARRDAAAAHTAVRRPIRGGGSGCEDLRGDGRRTAAAGLCGPAQAPHRPGTGDSGAPCPPWVAAEGAGRSGCRDDSHLRGSRCWRGLSVAVMHSIVNVQLIV